MAMPIHRATPADLEELLPLMRAMQLEDPWSEPFVESALRANLDQLLRLPSYGAVFLVREGSTPVAYLALCFDFSLEYRGKGAWIDELFVVPSCRGRGIGTQLLAQAESASRELGAQCLHLEVNHENPAVALYRRRGFVDHDRYLMTKALCHQEGARVAFRDSSGT
jgi:ribosomal protein S18 acetylase RimI-like enzyme